MLRSRFACRLAVLTAIAWLVWGELRAHADFVLIISDGVGDAVVANQTTGTITTYGGASVSTHSFGSGSITISAAMGNISLSMNSISGSSGLSIGNLMVSTLGSAQLTVTAYQTGDTLKSAGVNNTGLLTTNMSGTLSGGGSVSTTTYLDGSNQGNGSTPPAFSAPNGSQIGFTQVSTQSVFSGTGTTVMQLPANDTVALMDTATLTFAGAGNADFDVSTSLVAPAPAGFVLVLSALPVVGLCFLRRRLRIAA
jgi:hypothetical protein